MIGRQRNGDELREDFKVLGSTGNVGSFCSLPKLSHAFAGVHSQHRSLTPMQL